MATDLFDYEQDPLETSHLAGNPEQQALMNTLAQQLREDGQGCDRLMMKTKTERR